MVTFKFGRERKRWRGKIIMGKVLKVREVGDPILGIKCEEVDLL